MTDALMICAGVLAALFLLSLTPLGSSFRKRLMAILYVAAQRKYELFAGPRKQQLFAGLSGTVLEIGPGTGANFEHFPDGVTRWIGIEPNPHMHRQLREAGARRGIETDFRLVTAGGMQVQDESMDAVVSTLVLCSVPDPELVLRDVRRVLKPGGRFVFVEHVAAPRGSRLRRKQRWSRPFWWYFADGCCPDRELAEQVRAAGFRSVDLEEYEVPREAASPVVSPHIEGVAVK